MTLSTTTFTMIARMNVKPSTLTTDSINENFLSFGFGSSLMNLAFEIWHGLLGMDAVCLHLFFNTFSSTIPDGPCTSTTFALLSAEDAVLP